MAEIADASIKAYLFDDPDSVQFLEDLPKQPRILSAESHTACLRLNERPEPSLLLAAASSFT